MNQTPAADDLPSPPPPQVCLPGCKSLSQRALILAAGGRGSCRLSGLSSCDDSRYLLQALRGLGVGIEPVDDPPASATADSNTEWLVHGLGHPPRGKGQVVDVGEAGSSLRFLLPWTAAGSGEFVLTGAPRLFERPHQDLIDFLRDHGSVMEEVEIDGRPGLRVQAGGIPAGRWQPPCRHSSQYVSGLVMASTWTAQVEWDISADLPSRGYFDLTLEAMRAFQADDSSRAGHDNPSHWQVPGDPSGATFFLSALVLTGGHMRLGPEWSMTHPEAQLLRWFEQSGLLSRAGENWRYHCRTPTQTHINLDPAPDAGPALAVLGAFLETGLTLNGIQRLRIKESDRVAGIQRLLHAIGAEAEVVGDSLRIHPRQAENEALTEPYHPDGDHRLAMAAGVARLRVPGLQIDQQQCVAKSFPDFWQQLAKLY